MDVLQTNDDSAPASTGADIVDVGIDNFIAEVVEASQTRPVLLDFWAPWCEPCKQLTPLLEKIVAEHNGALKLAKMDIDAHPAVAQQMQVQSIPAVFLFRDGQPVDGFMGVQPESTIREFLAKHMTDAASHAAPANNQNGVQDLAEAQAALANDDIATAMQIFANLMQSDPDNEVALAGLATCYVKSGNVEQARALLDMVADSTHNDIVRVRADISLHEKIATNASANGSDTSALQAALVKNENNHQARFDLALAHYGAGEAQAAIDTLLALIERDRKWNEDAARKQLLEFFEAYGADSPLVEEGRRRLSSILFS